MEVNSVYNADTYTHCETDDAHNGRGLFYWLTFKPKDGSTHTLKVMERDLPEDFAEKLHTEFGFDEKPENLTVMIEAGVEISSDDLRLGKPTAA
jgi:hypothetical protein